MAERAWHGQQLDLFLTCEECGSALVRTASCYLACPAGHGRLRLDVSSPVVRELENDLFGGMDDER